MAIKEDHMANVMFDRVEITRRDQTKLILYAVHVPDPEIWDLNPEGVVEDYYIIKDGIEPAALIRVLSRSPFKLEQVDFSTAPGAEYRQRVRGYLQSEKSQPLG
jgi:hypothetical protein